MRNEQYLLFTPLPIPLLFVAARSVARPRSSPSCSSSSGGGDDSTEGMAVPDWPATFQRTCGPTFREMLEQQGRDPRARAPALGVGARSRAFTVMLTTYVHRSRRP